MGIATNAITIIALGAYGILATAVLMRAAKRGVGLGRVAFVVAATVVLCVVIRDARYLMGASLAAATMLHVASLYFGGAELRRFLRIDD